VYSNVTLLYAEHCSRMAYGVREVKVRFLWHMSELASASSVCVFLAGV
jgi:hypothetical protein